MDNKDNSDKFKKIVVIAFFLLLSLFIALVVKAKEFGISGRNLIVEILGRDENRKMNIDWEVYNDDVLGFSIPFPKGSESEVLENQGGYLKFVRFISNQKTLGKSVSVGVTEQRNLKQEANFIIKEFEKGDRVVLTNEQDIKIAGLEGKRFDFEPLVEDEFIEARSILIVEKDGKTYSVSTTPDQTEYLTKNFILG